MNNILTYNEWKSKTDISMDDIISFISFSYNNNDFYLDFNDKVHNFESVKLYKSHNDDLTFIGTITKTEFITKDGNKKSFHKLDEYLESQFGKPRIPLERYITKDYREVSADDVMAFIKKIFAGHNQTIKIQKYQDHDQVQYVIGNDKKYRVADGWISRETDYKIWNHKSRFNQSTDSPLAYLQAVSFELDEIQYEK